jgi:hypothetical protein
MSDPKPNPKPKNDIVDLVSLETEENDYVVWADDQVVNFSISHVSVILPIEDFPELVELLQKSRRKFDEGGVLGVETENCLYRVEICEEHHDSVHLDILAPGVDTTLTLVTEEASKLIEVFEEALMKMKEKGLL